MRMPVCSPCKYSGRRSRRGQAEHLASVLGPSQSEGPHGDRLPGAGEGDRELRAPPGGAHLPNQEAALHPGAVPFAAISSNASSTATWSTADPSRRPAVVTRRFSASRIRCEVYRSAPAAVYTDDPSTRRNGSGSRMLSGATSGMERRRSRTSSTSRSTSTLVDADDFPDRPLRRVGAGPFGEPHR